MIDACVQVGGDKSNLINNSLKLVKLHCSLGLIFFSNNSMTISSPYEGLYLYETTHSLLCACVRLLCNAAKHLTC
jgi:hypothetical protein